MFISYSKRKLQHSIQQTHSIKHKHTGTFTQEETFD